MFPVNRPTLGSLAVTPDMTNEAVANSTQLALRFREHCRSTFFDLSHALTPHLQNVKRNLPCSLAKHFTSIASYPRCRVDRSRWSTGHS